MFENRIAFRTAKEVFSQIPNPSCYSDEYSCSLMLLVYFYPLHNACAAKTSSLVKMLGSTTAFGIIRVMQLIGLANCSIVPVVLKSCIDEYSKVWDLCDDENGKDYLAVLGKDDAKCFLVLPSLNVSSVTYDVLTENMVDIQP